VCGFGQYYVIVDLRLPDLDADLSQ